MSVGEMARRVVTFDNTATRTAASILFLLVLLQATLVWDQATSAPAKRDEILAGTDFLSVFINGAMAPTPPRRRGSRRGLIAVDNVASESQQHEAAIYRISRTSRTSQARPGSRATTPGSPRQEGISRFYPISQKSLDNSADLVASVFEEPSSTDERLESSASPVPDKSATTTTTLTMRNGGPEFSSQRVIGVSVTSTVEATPYKVRVEHYVGDEMTTMSRTSATKPIRTPTTPRPVTPLTTSRKTPTTTTTTTTPISALLVTEEFGNLVSESNGSDFSVDEGTPRTSWRNRPRTMHRPSSVWHVSTDSDEPLRLTEPTSTSEEAEPRHQGRKAARHYESGIYAQTPRLYSEPSKVYGKPSRVYGEPETVYSEPAKVYGEPAQTYGAPAKVYGEPAKVYSEPSKVYGEPEKVYAEPSKVYSEPSKVYGEPEKVYSEPAKIYGEPAKVYGEPAKVYSEPAKVYSEPAKTYGSDGQPVVVNATERREENAEEDEPREEEDEKNDEVDESSSIDSFGSIYGRRTLLDGGSEARGTDDGNKVGFVMEGRNYRKYRVEERTPDGFIVGEYGVVSHDDGSLRGVRYTADGSIDPQIIYDILKKYFDP